MTWAFVAWSAYSQSGLPTHGAWRGSDGKVSIFPYDRPPVAKPAEAGAPEPLVLHCPACGVQHVDEGEWATRPHKTHRCASCGHEWRPKQTPTVGVVADAKRCECCQRLPGDCSNLRNLEVARNG